MSELFVLVLSEAVLVIVIERRMITVHGFQVSGFGCQGGVCPSDWHIPADT